MIFLFTFFLLPAMICKYVLFLLHQKCIHSVPTDTFHLKSIDSRLQGFVVVSRINIINCSIFISLIHLNMLIRFTSFMKYQLPMIMFNYCFCGLSTLCLHELKYLLFMFYFFGPTLNIQPIILKIVFKLKKRQRMLNLFFKYD